ncbi:hypothetical protein DUNSADRAFT_14522 [Dunaliella salina]|uniref:Uncharacterized protein n=1 Tax=Dunaliella salina TaxID=3046 RepID=A0ABQ7G7D3_DUNSA|nr:hypothetical protein DUNSADRAFT_14522 [Dunaliella salina]|eukprot:KAF5830481.1 hypothetical protein DUNSADRAFT_14522 [Dunaliella salina]
MLYGLHSHSVVCKQRLFHSATAQSRQMQHMRRATSVTQYLPSTKSEAVQLTMEMKSFQSWPELEALFEEHKGDLWPINIAALHTRISQVTWPASRTAVLPPPGEAAALGYNDETWDEPDHLFSVDEEGLPQPVFAVRVMEAREVDAFHDFYARLAYTTGRAMRRGMAMREICTIARAAAQLGVHNGWLLDELREASLPFLQSSARKYGTLDCQISLKGGLRDEGAAMDLRQMAQLAYSFGKLHFVPEGVWMPCLLVASQAAMQHTAPAATAPSSLSSSRDSIQEDSMGSNQTLPLASTRLQSAQTSPEASQWRYKVQERLQAQTQQLEKQVPRSKQIWQRPIGQNAWLPEIPAPLQQQQQQQQQELAGSMHRKELMQSLANLVYALIVLMGIVPPKTWMTQFFAASLPQLHTASGAELVQVVRALQTLSSDALVEQLPGQQLQQQQQQQQCPSYHFKRQQVRQRAGKSQLQLQQQKTRQHLSMHGVPDAWSAALLQAIQRQASAAAPDKFKELLSKLTCRIEAACRQKEERRQAAKNDGLMS